MPDPVLSRPMFGNGQPPAQPSPDLSSLAPKGQAAERAGLYAVAKATDDFSNQVQQAGDYEQLMNTIRGDNKTIEDRRSELAGIVGVLDAQRTPVSVLTVMQPAIELLSNQQTPSGITSLVDDGSEAPAEEPQRFAKGGLVQRRRYADGGLAQSAAEYDRMLQQRLGPERSIDDYVAERQRILGGQDTSNLDANLALMGYGARVATTPGNLITALASPLPDFGKELSGIANKKSDRDRAIRLNALEARDKDKSTRQQAGIDALRTAFTEYNSNKRTGMQIEATAQENRLNRDLTRSENEANRTLTREEGAAGRRVTQEEGAATRQVTRDEGAATRENQRVLQEKNIEFQKGEGEANRGVTREEGAATRQQQIKLQESQQNFQRGENEANRTLTREEGAAGRAVTTSEGAANRQQQTDLQRSQQNFTHGQTQIQLNAHPEQPYIVSDGKNTQIVRAKPSVNGWIDASTGQPLPKDSVPLNENTFRMYGGLKADPKDAQNVVLPDGAKAVGVQVGQKMYGLDGKELPAGTILDKNNDVSQPFNMVVEDPNAPGGIRQVLGRQRGQVNEVLEKGQWVPIDTSKNYARGELKDFVNPQSSNGQTTWSPTWGPMSGKSYTTGQSSGTNINTDTLPSPNSLKGDPVAPQKQTTNTVSPEAAPAAQEARDALLRHKPAERDKFTIGAITGEGTEGRFTKALEKPYVTWDRMSSDDKNKTLDRINYSQGFLKSSDEFLKAIPEAVGPYNQVKSFSTNVIAPFLPEGFGYEKMAWLKTEQAKRQLQDLRQQLRQSQSLNPRFPVGELNVIDELAENPDKFFANPAAGLARLKETIRVTRNNLEYDRARLENRQPLYIDRVPEGTKDDPLPANRADYIYDLRKQGVSTKGIHIADDKGNIIRLSE